MIRKLDALLARRFGRRGANALEFALTLPIFLSMVMGIFEYGWLYFQRASIVQGSISGCRTGVVVHPEAATPPNDVAEAAIESNITALGFDCTTPAPVGDCDVNCNLVGSSPDERLVCAIEVNYSALTGYVPFPDHLDVNVDMYLELQR